MAVVAFAASCSSGVERSAPVTKGVATYEHTWGPGVLLVEGEPRNFGEEPIFPLSKPIRLTPGMSLTAPDTFVTGVSVDGARIIAIDYLPESQLTVMYLCAEDSLELVSDTGGRHVIAQAALVPTDEPDEYRILYDLDSEGLYGGFWTPDMWEFRQGFPEIDHESCFG